MLLKLKLMITQIIYSLLNIIIHLYRNCLKEVEKASNKGAESLARLNETVFASGDQVNDYFL